MYHALWRRTVIGQFSALWSFFKNKSFWVGAGSDWALNRTLVLKKNKNRLIGHLGYSELSQRSKMVYEIVKDRETVTDVAKKLHQRCLTGLFLRLSSIMLFLLLVIILIWYFYFIFKFWFQLMK